MTYFNEVVNPKVGLVSDIIIRPKGLILKCPEYDLFLWKDSKEAVALNKLIELWKKDESTQRLIKVVPNKKLKKGYDVTLYDECKYFFFETKISTSEENQSAELSILKEIEELINGTPSHEKGKARKPPSDKKET